MLLKINKATLKTKAMEILEMLLNALGSFTKLVTPS